MEFFYTVDDKEHGPFSERQMTDWVREYPFGEDRKIRFNINDREYNTTLARMRAKNGHCTPFNFAKCERVDREKELRKEIEEGNIASRNIESEINELRLSCSKTSLVSRQLMERMQRKIEAATAMAERVKREEERAAAAASAPTPSVPKVAVVPPVSKTPLPVKQAANEQSTSKTPKRLLPLFDVGTERLQEEVEDDKKAIKAFRDFLDDFDLAEAQKALKFPIADRCRGCDFQPTSEKTDLRVWLCHITAKSHIDKFRQKGGRVTQDGFDWYINQLSQFLKKKVYEKEKEPEVEETVDLEKKKLECFGGVILLPTLIPLLHYDPSDTTKLSWMNGKNQVNKLRSLVFNATDRQTAARSFVLPRTHCDFCNENFDYAPYIVPHALSNTHIEKYLAKRGSFSQHDFNFWTEICKLFPEAGKDTRDFKEVRAKLREMGKILEISTCKDSQHLLIYGGEDRRRHVVGYIKKQLVEHTRPVVVYMRSEDVANELIEHLKVELPETRIGYARNEEECSELEVIVSDCNLRLTRPHAIAFLYAPFDPKQKADYAQKMCGEYVESNLIVAYGFDEHNELRKFSRLTTSVPLSPQKLPPPPSEFPTDSTVPTVPTVFPSAPTVPPPIPSVVPSSLPPPRVSLPIASIPPYNPFNSLPRSESYPTAPLSQRRYDPNQVDESSNSPKSPKSPGESKKSNCSLM